ncbi:hypothetical protein PHPALM_30870 [Phytophthora palmivora]|uniref:Uncharacterized protein n=1 Tax=Phytophthora palmivora TaxID=4796 RepID=A0A2P4X404_9STRA|nr:hypothetical protein PHPALM_30870 [Phytophthora palmivora]
MVKAHKPVDDSKPPLQQRNFGPWDKFHKVLKTYEAGNYVTFRARTSVTRDQVIRCFAMLFSKVVEHGVAKWQVTIGKEISERNHQATKITYDSYKGAKSLPLPPEVRQDLVFLADMNTNSADINPYLSNKIGECSW